MSIKNIKEKQLLVNLANQLGEQPEPKVVETTFSELDDLEKYLQEEKTDELVQEKTEIKGTAETNTASEQSSSTKNIEGNERESESIREEKLEELTSLVDS